MGGGDGGGGGGRSLGTLDLPSLLSALSFLHVRKFKTVQKPIYSEVFCKGSPLKLLSKILEKHLRKRLFLVRLQVLKMNLFTHIFQSFSYFPC